MADTLQSSSFNPYTQNFTLLMSDGETKFQVDIPSLDQYVLYNSEVCINYASQIGASLIMLIVVLLVTRESKRRSPIFIINLISLVLSTLRSLLQTLYWVGPFTESYSYFSGEYEQVPRSAYANSIASLVMTLLFLSTVELSLVLQTNVVCTTLRDLHRWGIMALSCVIAILTVALRFGATVENAKSIISLETTYHLEWLFSAALIMETISIWFFCIIFVAKLGITIFQRQKLGLKQWGPMQIICIMGGCTMVIPSIFAILEYFPNATFPEAGSLALTLVAIFLPLSSVWAAAAMDGTSPIQQQDKHAKFGSYSQSGSTALMSDRKGSLGVLNPKNNMTIVEHISMSRGSEIGKGDDGLNHFDDDLETGMGRGVKVERSFKVSSSAGHGRLGSAGRA